MLFIVIFVMLVIVVIGAYRWLIDAVSPLNHNQEPGSGAVRVFVNDPSFSEKQQSVLDRLRWFYWYGEK